MNYTITYRNRLTCKKNPIVIPAESPALAKEGFWRFIEEQGLRRYDYQILKVLGEEAE